MRSSEWTYLLKLLGLVVMIDGKVYQEEMSAFTKAALKLQEVLSPDIFLTRAMVLDWFLNHREELRDIVNGLEYDTHIIAIIAPIRGLNQKKAVLNAMILIAQADGFYHGKERMIINKAAKYWNVPTSDLACAEPK